MSNRRTLFVIAARAAIPGLLLLAAPAARAQGDDFAFRPPFPKAAYGEIEIWGGPILAQGGGQLALSRTVSTLPSRSSTSGGTSASSTLGPESTQSSNAFLVPGLGSDAGVRLLYWLHPSLGLGASFQTLANAGDVSVTADSPQPSSPAGLSSQGGTSTSTTLTTTSTMTWMPGPDPWTGVTAPYGAVATNAPVLAGGAYVNAQAFGASGFDPALSFAPAVPGPTSGLAFLPQIAGANAPVSFLNTGAIPTGGAGSPTMSYTDDVGETFSGTMARTLDETRVWAEPVLASGPNAELTLLAGIALPRIDAYTFTTARLASGQGQGAASEVVVRNDPGGGTGFTETTSLAASETRSSFASGLLVGPLLGLRTRVWAANGLQLYAILGWSPALAGTVGVTSATAVSGNRTTTYSQVGANAESAVTRGDVVVPAGTVIAEGATYGTSYARTTTTSGSQPLAMASLTGVEGSAELGARYEVFPDVSLLGAIDAETLSVAGPLAGAGGTAAAPYSWIGGRVGVVISL